MAVKAKLTDKVFKFYSCILSSVLPIDFPVFIISILLHYRLPVFLSCRNRHYYIFVFASP